MLEILNQIRRESSLNTEDKIALKENDPKIKKLNYINLCFEMIKPAKIR